MNTELLVVLWEDSASGSPSAFAPGILLQACIADRLGLSSAYEARVHSQIRHHPCNGNDKLLREMQSQAALLRPPTRAIAVFDSDRINDLATRWKIAPWPADITEREARLLALIPPPADRYSVVLLIENMESVVNVSSELLGRPLERKELFHRDRTLHALANDPSAQLRAELSARVPSWNKLVDRAELAFLRDEHR